MRLLLDTHALIWWLADAPSLSRPAYDAIAEMTNDVFVSAASAWEVTTKHRLGKLPHAGLLAHDFEGVIAAEGFAHLDISIRHAAHAGNLAIAHRDPFDRMLIAQSLLEDMVLVSSETPFDHFGVNRLW